MHELFTGSPARKGGTSSFPELAYLRRVYEQVFEEVRQYYRVNPKRVGADNFLGKLLKMLPLRWDLNDEDYFHYIDDYSAGVTRAFGIVSPVHSGRVHEKGVTLGDKSNEIVVLNNGTYQSELMGSQWVKLPTYEYLYHTRTDIRAPIMNNTTPGPGYGVGALNLPLMALQYRKWLKLRGEGEGQTESVFRFVGGVVLPNAVESFFDIAVFNHLNRKYMGSGIPKLVSPHPFYVVDVERRVDQLCDNIIKDLPRRNDDIERLMWSIPMVVNPKLWDVMELPDEPVTRNNEWALAIARYPYVRFAVEAAVRTTSGDRSYLNEIHESVYGLLRDRVFSGKGSMEFVKDAEGKMNTLLDRLEELDIKWHRPR